MNTVSIVSGDTQMITDFFESSLNKFPNEDAVVKTRREAFDHFVKLGFPLKSNEEYKYSGTEKLLKEEPNWIDEQVKINHIDFDQYRNQNSDVAHVFFVNGELVLEESELSTNNSGAIICDLKSAALNHAVLFETYFGKNLKDFNDAFAQLNTAMATNGLFIYIPQNQIIEKPLQINNILHASSNQFFNLHHLIVAEKSAGINIIETFNSHESTSKYILNVASEVTVGPNASVNYYRLQHENENAIHINTTQVLQSNDSHFDTNTITLGAKWLRNNLNIVLNGIHCETHLNGLQLLYGQQHVDNHTLVDHRVPHCESNQLYKSILKDKSTGVFNGKIFVRKDAQKTNAYQSSKNMLLSDDATMNTKPQLEIYADDVKCSHGSSTGQIDDNALFYLRARGLSIDSAKSLLMYAFAIDVIQTIKIESYKNYLAGLIEKCFE